MKLLGVQMDIAFHRRDGKSFRAIARELGIDPRTAKKYAEHPELINKPRKKAAQRPALLDPYRDLIAAYLRDDEFLQATAIYDRLCRQRYTGAYETVKKAVRPRVPA